MTATDTETDLTGAQATNRLESLNPATGAAIGSVPILDAADVEAALARARTAFHEWGALGHSDRKAQLLAWRRELARRIGDLADLVHRENGKTPLDSYQEVFISCGHLTYAATRAEQALRSHKVPSGTMANFRATVSYQPFGVVGIIGPWNYPIFTPMGSIAFALAAGNTVVFKPSELTPLVGRALADAADAAIDIPNVLQVITGDGRTGAALASSPNVDKLAFTGSTETGRKVMAAAAENLTPVVLELGGKDPLIVAADADVAKAAEAAVFGALTNTGQACVSIERAYVVDSVYESFIQTAVEKAADVRAGSDDNAHIGPMTDPRQVEKVRAQLEDAATKGATFLLGGPDSVKDGNTIEPVVVADVTGEMRLMQEETFGPILPVVRVKDADEALRRANETKFSLGSAVFGRAGVRRLADRVRAGMTSVNSVIAFSAIAALPFGGVGGSGFGRIHGDEGLREFARTKATAEEKFSLPIEVAAFMDKPKSGIGLVRTLTQQLYGGGVLDKADSLLRRLRR